MLNAAICIKGYRIPNKRSRAAPPRTDVALKCVYWEGEAFRNVQTLQGCFNLAFSTLKLLGRVFLRAATKCFDGTKDSGSTNPSIQSLATLMYRKFAIPSKVLHLVHWIFAI